MTDEARRRAKQLSEQCRLYSETIQGLRKSIADQSHRLETTMAKHKALSGEIDTLMAGSMLLPGEL